MSKTNKQSDWVFQPLNSPELPADTDAELAYQLHHSQSSDPELRSRLVARFAPELQRLAVGWIELSTGKPAPQVVINSLLVDILVKVNAQAEHFRGEENIRNWVLRIAVKQLLNPFRSKFSSKCRKTFEEETLLAQISCLARPEQQILWLHYGMMVSLPDCAVIIGEHLNCISKRLNDARLNLLSPEWLSDKRQECQDCLSKLWARMDNLSEGDEEGASWLDDHLSDCPICRSLFSHLEEIEHSLVSVLANEWPLPNLKTDELQKINEAISARMGKPRLPVLKNQVLKLTWTGLFIMIFIAAGMFLMQLDINESDQDLVLAPEQSELPDLVQNGLVPEGLFLDAGVENEMQYMTQDQSEDGGWIAFITYNGAINGGIYSIQEEVVLYNTTTQVAEIIYTSPMEEIIGSLRVEPPAISGDGVWIAFSALNCNSRVTGNRSTTDMENPCWNIYLYNQVTKDTLVISRAWDGTQANGDSYSPAITADGRLVAFWSEANNLVEGEDVRCTGEAPQAGWGVIYLYTRDDGKLARLPVENGTTLGDTGYNKLSLSADGNIIAYTTQSIHPLSGSRIFQSYVFDRGTGSLEAINQAPDGSDGNGNSFGAVLDASGQYIAFVADSSNLVSNDTNGAADVFWRDRTTDETERISFGQDGEQSNADSGVLASGSGYHPSFDLSQNGQQIVYQSQASNLVDNPGDCHHQIGDACYALYFYDRQLDKTELIVPSRDLGLTMFPSISADGRWVTYSGFQYDYPLPRFHASIHRYDRQRQWDHYLFGSTNPPAYSWGIDRSVSLPGTHGELVAYTNDGSHLAIANRDGMVRITRLSDLTQVANFAYENSSVILSLAFAPDNTLLAGGTTDGKVYVWDITTLRPYYILEDMGGRVIDVFFSDNGDQLLIVTGEDVSIWQFGDQIITRVKRLFFEGPGVLDTDLSPTGNLLASARQDGTVWLQMLPNGLLLSRLGGHEVAVSQVLFSSEGTRLVSRSVDGIINIWDILWQGFGELEISAERSFDLPNWIGNLSCSAGCDNLATVLADGGMGIWNVSHDYIFRADDLNIDYLAFSPQVDTLATIEYGNLNLWSGFGPLPGKYFIQADSDTLGLTVVERELIEQPAAWLEKNISGWDSMTLYEADVQWTNDLLAPAHLPEEVAFQGAYLMDDGSMVLSYSITHENETSGTMYIREKPLTDGQNPGMMVGSNAEVYTGSWSNHRFEYVIGDWLPADVGGEASVIWDHDAMAQRMSWEQGTMLITVIAPRIDTLTYQSMLQLAQGFSPVSMPVIDSRVVIEYQVQPGDTCSWLSERFLTTIEEIIAMNQAVGNCDLIYAGQTLSLPANIRKPVMPEIDFDCDGRYERVEAVIDSGIWTGVRILTFGETGFYQPIWEWTSESQVTEWLKQMTVLYGEGCSSWLGIEVANRYSTRWLMFSWDGVSMQPVFVTPSELEQLFLDNGDGY